MAAPRSIADVRFTADKARVPDRGSLSAAGFRAAIRPRSARMDRYAADRMVKRLVKRAGIAKRISPHSLRHSFITAPSTPASRCETSKRPPATPTPEPPCVTTEQGAASTDTPSTSCPPAGRHTLSLNTAAGRYRAPIPPSTAGYRAASPRSRHGDTGCPRSSSSRRHGIRIEHLTDRIAYVTRGLGIVAEKGKIAWTCLDDSGCDRRLDVDEEEEVSTPASQKSRGAQLSWLLTEAQGLITRLKPNAIVLQKPGTSAGRDRIEVEGVVQVAAHIANVPLKMLTRDQVRARVGAPHGKDAFKRLLQDIDVAARSSADKRERYLFAKAALRL
jgi:Phage integrase family